MWKKQGCSFLPHTYWAHSFGLCRNWKALVNGSQLSKQVVTPITAALPDFVSFMEQINIALAHGMQLMSWQWFFLYVIKHRPPEAVWVDSRNMSLSYLGSCQFFLCHHADWSESDCFPISQDILASWMASC